MQTTPEYHNLQVHRVIRTAADDYRAAAFKLLYAIMKSRETTFVAWLVGRCDATRPQAEQTADRAYTQPWRDAEILIHAAYDKFGELEEKAQQASENNATRLDMASWTRIAHTLLATQMGELHQHLTRGVWDPVHIPA